MSKFPRIYFTFTELQSWKCYWNCNKCRNFPFICKKFESFVCQNFKFWCTKYRLVISKYQILWTSKLKKFYNGNINKVMEVQVIRIEIFSLLWKFIVTTFNNRNKIWSCMIEFVFKFKVYAIIIKDSLLSMKTISKGKLWNMKI